MTAITENPQQFIRLALRKIYLLWKNDHDIAYWNFAGVSAEAVRIGQENVYWLTNFIYTLILFLGCMGAVLVALKIHRSQYANAKDVYLCAAGVIGGLTLAYLPFFGVSRFHFAMVPLLFLFIPPLFMELSPILQSGMSESAQKALDS